MTGRNQGLCFGVCLALCGARAAGDLLISSDFSHEIFAHDLVSGTQTGGGALVTAASGGLDQPHGILPLPDGMLVASFGTDEVKRYDRATGAYIDDFLASPASGLDDPVYLELGPQDGLLYVTSQGNDRVLRFDAETGAASDGSPFIDGGGLDGPSGLDWSPDGSVLYVAGRYSGDVRRYDAATGTPSGNPLLVSGLNSGTTFGLAVDDASGDVFVASGGNVSRYTAAGVFVAEIAVPGLAIGLEPGPAGESIYVASNNNLYRISLTDHSLSGPLLSGSVINVLNFFHIEPADTGLELVSGGVEEIAPGVEHYAVTFSFSADAWGARVTLQRSDDLMVWEDAGSYTVGTTAVARDGSEDSVQTGISQVDSTVTVTERDHDPIGPGARFYRVKGE